MYDFGRAILFQNGQEAEIESFRVEFVTPWGAYSTLKEAVQKCSELDMDPTLIIQPTVVIYDKAGRSEAILRAR